MKNLLLLLVIGLFVNNATAQDSTSVKLYDFPFFMYAGPQSIKASELNDMLTANGFTKLPNNALLFGTTSTIHRSRFGFGVSLEYLATGANQSGGNRVTSLKGITSGVHVSYYIIQKTDFTLYPILALRVARLEVRSIDKEPVANVNDALATAHRNATIRYVNDMIDLGIGMSARTMTTRRRFNCPQAERYLSFDARIGYNIAVGSRAEYNFASLSNAPELRFGGPYFRLGIGFGSSWRSLNWK